MSTARKKRKKRAPARPVPARLAALEQAQGVSSESIRALALQVAQLSGHDRTHRRRARELAARLKEWERAAGPMLTTIDRLDKAIGVVTARESYKLGESLQARIERVEQEIIQGGSPLHWQKHLAAAKDAARELMAALDRARSEREADGESSGGTEGETVQ